MADRTQQQIAITPDYIIDIIFRRRWFIIVPLCIVLSIGIYLSFTLPRTYQATTTILVQAQRVPGAYVKSIVSSDINERISTISQQIMSYSNLEKIIDQFGLYEDKESQNMYLEDKIKSMRQRVNVKLTRSRTGTDAFSISFTGKDPNKVMRIVNTLASFFMDENLKVREAQAIGTSEFLDSELEKTRKRLEQLEQELSDYRKKYLGGLPDELESNLRTLDRLQQQLTDKQSALREAKNDINTTENEILKLKRISFKSDQDVEFFSGGPDGTAFASDNRVKLEKAEKIREFLLLKYTDMHPDVIKINKTIAKLKELIDAEASAPVPVDEGPSQPKAVSPETMKRRLAAGDEKQNTLSQLDLQLQNLRSEVDIIEYDIEEINKKMKIYQQRVEETPSREQDLLSLQRDYGNLKEIYNSLLDRKLEAELAVNMEKKQKGEQFRILDHARMPEKPITPNVQKLLVFSLAAALGIAGGFIFLLEVFDTSIRRDEDIEKKLGLPILASIPPLKKKGSVWKKRVEFLAFSMMAAYVMALLALFIFLNAKGIGKVIALIKHYI